MLDVAALQIPVERVVYAVSVGGSQPDLLGDQIYGYHLGRRRCVRGGFAGLATVAD